MFPCRLFARRLCAVALVVFICSASLVADVAPEKLLSAKCAVAVRFDGFEPHRAAFERTALADLLKNDLGPLVADLQSRVVAALGPDIVARRLLAGGAPEELTALQAEAEQLPLLFQALHQRGLLFGVELAEGLIPGVQATLVFPNGASDEARLAIESTVRLVARLAEIKLTERTAGERTFVEGGFLGLGRVACWKEGPHVVVTIGTMPAESTIALSEGKGDSLADDPHWAELCAFKEYETYARVQIDTERIWRMLTQYVAPAKPILAQLGLDGLSRVSFQFGFEGRYQRLTVVLDTAAERRGLFNVLADGQTLALEKLPGLPPDASSVWTLRAEPTAVYGFVTESIEKILSVVEPSEVEAYKSDRAKFESGLGGEAFAKALSSLGPTVVAYNEPGGAIPLFGGALAIEVHDSEAFEQARDVILEALAQVGRDNFELVRRDYRGTKVYVFQSKQQFVPVHPSFAVCDGWLHVALSPQGVQGAIFRAREKGHVLDLSADLRKRIEQQTSTSGDATAKRKLLLFSQTDPRPSVKVLVGVVPLASRFLGFAQQDGVFQNFDTTLVPHAQPITDVLTENFSLLTSDPHAIRYDVYSTLPMPIDFASLGSLFALAGF